ncbi:hypothetical protein MRB53_038977 [Persea americana]|nr:hypothetical protein MRB53_038977 [Persea americana]
MGLKSYFLPAKQKAVEEKQEKEKVEHGIPQEQPTPPSWNNSASNSTSEPHWDQAESGRPSFDSKDGSIEDLVNIKCEVMVNWLHQQQMERLWTSGEPEEGVMLKKARGLYTCCPADLAQDQSTFFQAVNTLNVKLFLHNNNRSYVPLKNGLRLQVIPSMVFLPRCQKHQFAAFIADRGILVVWDDDPRHILERAASVEESLMHMIWNNDITENEKSAQVSVTTLDTVESGQKEPEQRRIVLIMPILSACTLCLTTIALGSGWRAIAMETFIDGTYLRLAFILCLLPQVWLALFFFQAVCGNIAQIIGPVAQMQSNTKYYSGIKPQQLRRDAGPLPHVTIQMPVYKEGLTSVIEPTIHSIKAAISTYEMQGGTANIFVNDDGMQLISEADARARQDFYDEHNIGWVARPKHNPKPKEGEQVFLRRGKFKKASNLNYAMWASARVEDKLAAIDRSDTWNQDNEAVAYQDALTEVIEEEHGSMWIDGNIRIGDYILIIDSDTRVPTDCFLDAVSEMEHSPEVAIIQFSAGVLNVTSSFFERGITFFTLLIYTAIKYAVANGDVAPFVGHNSIISWKAMQHIAYDDEEDQREKYWSESTVSEDFDMALRLQTAGYIVRLAAYAGDGFKEGVSLTVYDELARWCKYSYGTSELLFHPIRYWFTRGLFTKLFRSFIMSKMPLPSKLTILAYIGTYYALGSAWLLTLANYFLTGWFNGHLDHYYLDSFQAYFAIILVFSGLGNVSLAVLRYRIGEKSLISSLLENFRWIFLMTIFLGGISLHVSQAILSHMFSVDATWGATSKEAEDTTFFQEIPKILKNFKFSFAFCIFCITLMVVCAYWLPDLWKIDLFISIYPLSAIVAGHLLLPLVLNPGLMRFTF